MANDIFAGKRVLVTGGTGMLGMALVELLLQRSAHVRVTSLDDPRHLPESVEFIRLDLTKWDDCLQACGGIDHVFHLAGIKGGVGIGRTRAADFLEANGFMSLHMLKAARECNVDKYLYTSSIGVYPDVEVFKEDEVWDKPPHPSDRYAAWAKRIGELQCEAYLEQHDYKTCIVRPATIYGPYDNFDPETAMVIPALINRVCSREDPLVVWGDGSQVRDFIYSKDCAMGMIMVMENYYECDPINLGSGVGVSIRDIVQTICRHAPFDPLVEWDTSKPVGNKIRLMDMTKARKALGFHPKHSLDEGIKETIEWYLTNKEYQSGRYSVFGRTSAP